MLATYVDDLIIASNDDGVLFEIFNRLTHQYNMRITENPRSFIGLELEWSPDHKYLSISQTAYINRMSKIFNFDTGKLESTPMEHNLNIPVSPVLNDNAEFRALIGIFQYITRYSRAGISFAVNLLARHQGHVTSETLAYACRIGRYFYATKNIRLVYSSTSNVPLESYIDASHANAPNLRSTTGSLILHFGNLVHWTTKLQSLVTRSSTAAKIVAVTDSLDDVLTSRFFLSEIVSISTTVLVYEDNISAYRSLECGNSKKMRFILICASQVREAVENGNIKLISVTGRNQLADGLTKSLGPLLFCTFRNLFYTRLNAEE